MPGTQIKKESLFSCSSSCLLVVLTTWSLQASLCQAEKALAGLPAGLQPFLRLPGAGEAERWACLFQALLLSLPVLPSAQLPSACASSKTSWKNLEAGGRRTWGSAGPPTRKAGFSRPSGVLGGILGIDQGFAWQCLPGLTVEAKCAHSAAPGS